MELGSKRGRSPDHDDWGTNNNNNNGHPSKRPLVNEENGDDDPQPSQQNKMSFAERMKAKFNLKEGQGLGRNNQGRVNPVEESTQFGRRGLGYDVQGLKIEKVSDHVQEKVMVRQVPDFVPACQLPDMQLSDFDNWMAFGPRSLDLSVETRYCDAAILDDLLQHKSLLDHVDKKQFLPARTRANPFEKIKKEFFQNRAALKMANIDALFGFIFTRQPDRNALLYFADVCAGPGGFTEYVYWRKQGWRAKGFGFTLRGSHDFDLTKFNVQSPYDSFHCYYGVDNTGDVYNTASLKEFYNVVDRQTAGQFLHFVMADGGFDVSGNENAQEILNKQLLLCQFICGLSLVRKGGHFTCKMFDVFTPFSVGLLYLLWRSFDHTCIIKPHTSRPANSERYVVCTGLKAHRPPVVDYLFTVNDRLNSLKTSVNSQQDVIHIVPEAIIQQSPEFVQYMHKSNNLLAQKQIRALHKVHNFLKDRTLPSENQEQIRLDCLKEWHLPDHGPFYPEKPMNEQEFFHHLVRHSPFQTQGNVRPLSAEYIEGERPTMRSVRDWYCCVASLSTGRLTFLMGMSRGRVRRLEGSQWKQVDGMVLPAGTLLVVEMIQENEVSSKRKFWAFHIVDAVTLGKEDVRKLPYPERMTATQLMLESLRRDQKTQIPPVLTVGRESFLRAKKARPMTNLAELMGHVELQRLPSGEGTDFDVCGIYFVPVQTTTKAPPQWTTGTDDHGRVYFENPKNHQRTLQLQPLSFRKCLEARVLWKRQDHISAENLLRFVDKFEAR
eukprot:m.146621 g.146621  ORF g.146621 m.146621 type:complete len:776 (+) comp24321_c0_seq2:67-2394(+)